jgi:beta-lactamase class A
MNRRAATGCLAACLLAVPVRAADESGLTKLLAGETARFPGKLTVYVKQLTTGQEAAVAPDEPMSSMSVIKLGIHAKAYQMVERGALDLDERIIMKTMNLRGGSGIFQYHAPGLNPTLRDLLWEIVITSDNTATDACINLWRIPEKRTRTVGNDGHAKAQ